MGKFECDIMLILLNFCVTVTFQKDVFASVVVSRRHPAGVADA